MDYTQVKNDEHDYLMPTYGRFDAVLTHGKGAAAYGADEKEYIDFTSGIGVNALGYSDDGWVKAVTGQALKIQHISNLYYSPVQTQLAKALCEKTGFDKVFLQIQARKQTNAPSSLQENTALKRSTRRERASSA